MFYIDEILIEGEYKGLALIKQDPMNEAIDLAGLIRPGAPKEFEQPGSINFSLISLIGEYTDLEYDYIKHAWECWYSTICADVPAYLAVIESNDEVH